MKLLIVEDNDRMRSLIRRTVADLAETIHECSDGAEALAAYNTNCIEDLRLSDRCRALRRSCRTVHRSLGLTACAVATGFR